MDTTDWRRTVGLLIVASLCDACCNDGGTEALLPGTSTAPDRFVMATVPSGPVTGLLWSTMEVRVSPDGEMWSAPSYPLTADCGVPLAVDPNIGPGLGATSTHYLAAAYGSNGQLFFSKSRNGIQWTPAQVATTVDSGLGPDSRPSVVYDRDEEAWFAIISTYRGGNPSQPSFVYIDGPGAAARVPIPEWASRRGTSAAHTGIAGKRYMISHVDAIRTVRIGLYDSLPSDFLGSFAAISEQGSPLTSGGSPWITSTLTEVFLATMHNEVNNGVSRGVNEIWEYDADADEWSRLVTLAPAAHDHEGASVAGVRTNMVVASPGSQSTDVWHLEEDSRGVLRGEDLTLRTRSIKPAALAFGTKNGGAPLANVCGERPDIPPPQLLQSVFLRFRSFKRTVPPDPGDFDAAEDVELRVSHRTRLGFVDREYDADPNLPGVQATIVWNATKNQSHMFNEGLPGSSWPELRFLMQPDEVVKVTLTGDDGDSTVDITYAELSAPQGAGNAKTTHTIDENGQPAYQLIYDANVSEAQ